MAESASPCSSFHLPPSSSTLTLASNWTRCTRELLVAQLVADRLSKGNFPGSCTSDTRVVREREEGEIVPAFAFAFAFHLSHSVSLSVRNPYTYNSQLCSRSLDLCVRAMPPEFVWVRNERHDPCPSRWAMMGKQGEKKAGNPNQSSAGPPFARL